MRFIDFAVSISFMVTVTAVASPAAALDLGGLNLRGTAPVPVTGENWRELASLDLGGRAVDTERMLDELAREERGEPLGAPSPRSSVSIAPPDESDGIELGDPGGMEMIDGDNAEAGDAAAADAGQETPRAAGEGIQAGLFGPARQPAYVVSVPSASRSVAILPRQRWADGPSNGSSLTVLGR